MKPDAGWGWMPLAFVWGLVAGGVVGAVLLSCMVCDVLRWLGWG